ncbi:MAG: hypothetical protein JXA60_10640 [Candidatus Coatesbacteria bacterium]|nr:hypothetical protein [Candidatus Coatesbacteria bacterium]
MKKLLIITLIMIFLMLLSCDNPFEDSRSGNYAKIIGRVFEDSLNTIPARNVQITMTGDVSGEAPYHGGDITVFSQKDGSYAIEAFLGSYVDTLGRFHTVYYADVLVTFNKQRADSTQMDSWVYNSYFGGIRISPNKTISLHDVNLEQMTK